MGDHHIARTPPSVEEYLEAVMKKKADSSPGEDGIQYGVLQLLFLGTHQLVLTLLRHWWSSKEILSKLKKVQICSLHKDGDRLNMLNKRGIGLVSKLILILEAILISRLTIVLAVAQVRSKSARGGHQGHSDHGCDCCYH